MTAALNSGPADRRLRIAISSPDILARIQQVFASKNLAVEFNRLPYLEVTVRPALNVPAADRSAVENALHRLAGPAARPDNSPYTAPPARPCAEYRLDVIEVGDRPVAEHPRVARRRHLTPVPATGADHTDAADLDALDGPDADGRLRALSRRQREVIAMMSDGVRNAEIAAELHLSEKTVKNHINRIFKVLGVVNRVEAVLIWQRAHRTRH